MVTTLKKRSETKKRNENTRATYSMLFFTTSGPSLADDASSVVSASISRLSGVGEQALTSSNNGSSSVSVGSKSLTDSESEAGVWGDVR